MSNQIETDIIVDYGVRDRRSVALRIFLVIPIAIFASAFTTGLIVLPVVLSLVFRGSYPSYVLSFNKSLLALSTRISAYAFLLTDSYPSIEENEVVKVTFPEIAGGAKLNRYLSLVKWFLALPLYLVGFIYTVYALTILPFAWFTILLTGKLPEWCGTVLLGTTKFWNRVYGYAIVLVTDEYPSFSL